MESKGTKENPYHSKGAHGIGCFNHPNVTPTWMLSNLYKGEEREGGHYLNCGECYKDIYQRTTSQWAAVPYYLVVSPTPVSREGKCPNVGCVLCDNPNSPNLWTWTGTHHKDIGANPNFKSLSYPTTAPVTPDPLTSKKENTHMIGIIFDATVVVTENQLSVNDGRAFPVRSSVVYSEKQVHAQDLTTGKALVLANAMAKGKLKVDTADITQTIEVKVVQYT